MTYKQYTAVIRTISLLGMGYMLFEFAYHLSGLRLQGVEQIWPESAIVFARLFMWLWTSAALFIAVILFVIFKYFQQMKTLLRFSILPIIFHAGLGIYLSSIPYTKIFPIPSLYGGVLWYSTVLRLEVVALSATAGLILYGIYKKYL